ncbi:hypothetical protein SAMN02745195_02322 [Thermoanaerobacter uzonensis DSM 18761]|uniref:Response regulatory domain-containing protein n=1 Tax=Thermoanaerobacter uzonensis DSM 18761 TaxID=1123369 RepID=A0A1M5AKI2_9THEO|nr:hypothetical protein [Thermoanaerobacter uzonensis]SHF30627.1 hypothetical protein SAMN02745195_02322 [Thermoanaerobacter uzonensis DSM 18761]
MVLLATGIEALDKKLSEVLPNTAVVYYREAVFNFNFDTLIFSEALAGDLSAENLLFEVRKRGRRVIFLAGESINKDFTAKLFIMGIYDIVFEPVTAEKVKEIFEKPRSFEDVSYLLTNLEDTELKFESFVKSVETAKKQIEGIVKFLGESYRCTDLNEGLLKIEQLLVKEVLYEQDY